MDLREHLQLLRRRWLLLVLTVEAAALAGLVVTLLTPPVFESSARLFVPNPPAVAPGSGAYYSDSRFAQERVASYAELVTGPRVLETVRQDLGLATSLIDLREQVTAEPVPQTVLLRISVTDGDPVAAQRLAQAFADTVTRLVPELEVAPEVGHEDERVLVVEPAGEATRLGPRPLRTMGLSLALGLLVGAGMVILRESMDDRLRTEDRLRRLVDDVPVSRLDAVPPEDTGLARWVCPADQVRWLATAVQLAERAPRSLLLAGPAGGSEALDELGIDLALAVARTGVTVALVDATGPGLPLERLGLAGPQGLGDVLERQVTVEAALHTYDDHLLVLAPGARRSGQQPLRPQALVDLLDELRRRAELVLIAGPGLLTDPDAALLASATEGVVLAVEPGDAVGEVERCLDTVAHVGGRVVRAVLLTPQASRSRGAGGERGRGPRVPAQRRPGSQEAPARAEGRA